MNKNDARKTLFSPAASSLAALLALALAIPAVTADAQEESKKGEAGPPPAAAQSPQGWAAQLESLVSWIIKTRDLVPRTKECEPPCYVLDTMTLSGSVDENSLRFTITGGVIADKPVLVPLFGPPHEVMLGGVTLGGRKAVVGFDTGDFYFVRTAEKSFTISGTMSLGGDLSFTIPGPLNLFISALDDGRVVEGEKLSGLSGSTIHLELGKKLPEEVLAAQPPVFQVARALRIQKEITFEYLVTVSSGSEVSTVTLPLPSAEMVLDVPGFKGWKQEGALLTVPTSGRVVEFTVYGSMPKIARFKPDGRCSYEWWLIESDPEHRVIVKTEARQVDSSESPIGRQLASGRLYLVTKGQDLDVSVQSLASMEALAVVISSQSRFLVWTKDGDLVVEDHLSYENNGIDYLSFDTAGKPVYLEVDGEPQKILTDDASKKNSILIPLNKGRHSVRVQSLAKSDPSIFGGKLRVPVAGHPLTASRAKVSLGMPSRIFPLWFSGGEGIRSPVRTVDLVFIAIALVMALLIFKGRNARIAGFLTLAGVYFILPPLFVALFILSAGIALVVLIWRRLKDWKRVLAFVLLGIVLVVTTVAVSILLVVSKRAMEPLSVPLVQEQPDRYAKFAYKEETAMQQAQMGQRALESQRQQELNENALGNVLFQGLASVQGVTPVALPLPSYEKVVSVTRELVTKDRPLAPSLIYVTRTALWPLLVIWLACLAFAGYQLWPRTVELTLRFLQLWRK